MPYGPLQVCQSAAGFYIGRMFTYDAKEAEEAGLGFPEGFQEPGSRESGYFATRVAAEADLASGVLNARSCLENDRAYDTGAVPDLRIGRTNPETN